MPTRKTVKRALIGALAACAATAAVAVLIFTGPTATFLVTAGGSAPTLAADPPVAEGVRWHDDYFAVQAIDARTFAIGAPPYPLRAMSYLIVGDDRAVLFDTGPGLRDIDGVVAALTDRPVIAAASHLHYDHVGSLDRFAAVALADVPSLRALADPKGRVVPPDDMHLGEVEAVAPEPFTVTEWWADGQRVALGGRAVEVWHTPGHTDGSMMLFDRAAGQLYTGDFIYPGNLLALFPGAHMGRYLESARRLVGRVPDGATLYPGHLDLEISPWRLQTLAPSDLRDLADALEALRDGRLDMQALMPPTWPINDRIRLIGTYRWNMAWAP